MLWEGKKEEKAVLMLREAEEDAARKLNASGVFEDLERDEDDLTKRSSVRLVI